MLLGGILFDLDDTLFAREAAFWSWLAEEAGDVQLDRALIAGLDQRGRGPKPVLLEYLSRVLHWREVSVEARLRRLQAGILRQARPHAELSALLARLGRRFRLGLVSNGSSLGQRAKLRELALQHCFDPVIISDEVGHRKPDFAIFRLATRGWALPHEQVLFVGDDARCDIGGARGAGLRPLQVLSAPPGAALPSGLPAGVSSAQCAATPVIASVFQLEAWLIENASPLHA